MLAEIVSVVVAMAILSWIAKSLAAVLILGIGALGVMLIVKLCN